MVIYADILFAVNAVMDLMCLFVTGKVLNLRIKKTRLAAGCIVGGVYGVLAAFFLMCEPFCSIAVSVIMLLASFDIKNLFTFVKAGVLLYSTGMLFGGILTFVQRIIYENRKLAIFSDGAGIWLFAVVAAVIFLFVLVTGKLFGIYIHRKNASCIISNGTDSKKIQLLIDTGNTLKDPYTGKAVIIVKAEALDELFGNEGIHRRYALCDGPEAVENKLYFISVKTVNGSSLLPVFGTLKVYMCNGKSKKTEINAVVASDSVTDNEYCGNDGIMPYMLSGSF